MICSLHNVPGEQPGDIWPRLKHVVNPLSDTVVQDSSVPLARGVGKSIFHVEDDCAELGGDPLVKDEDMEAETALVIKSVSGMRWFVFTLQHSNPAGQEVADMAAKVGNFDAIIVAPLRICDQDVEHETISVLLESSCPQDDMYC